MPPHKLWKPDVLMYNRYFALLIVNYDFNIIQRMGFHVRQSDAVGLPVHIASCV